MVALGGRPREGVSSGTASDLPPADAAFAPGSPHRLLLEAARPRLAFDPARPRGRTSLGEKILDCRAALAALGGFAETRGLLVWALGNSGGGALAWYLAAVEPAIAGLLPGRVRA